MLIFASSRTSGSEAFRVISRILEENIHAFWRLQVSINTDLKLVIVQNQLSVERIEKILQNCYKMIFVISIKVEVRNYIKVTTQQKMILCIFVCM